jgi:hypothetical protein
MLPKLIMWSPGREGQRSDIPAGGQPISGSLSRMSPASAVKLRGRPAPRQQSAHEVPDEQREHQVGEGEVGEGALA